MIAMSTRTKRLFDVVGAIGGLIVFAPPMAAIAAAILVLDGRPLLFRQARVGRGRRPFTILKFRSMRNGEVTAVGRVLRSTGLDELPQLVNVIGGDSRRSSEVDPPATRCAWIAATLHARTSDSTSG
jgi:lipopolysaccharide/colanic/teichoic acid biosynthesis glycosyltransferase